MSRQEYIKSQYRYERKFIIGDASFQSIEFLVKNHPVIFKEIYYPRYVNNIYFNTIGMNNYFDGVSGKKDRVKIRIRWYGDLFGLIDKPVLEFKIKKEFLGEKDKFFLNKFLFDKSFTAKKISNLFKTSNISNELKLGLMNSKPAIVNRFMRKYFLSADGNFRLTMDRGVKYYDVKENNNSFLHKAFDLENVIVELKYDQEFEAGAAGIVNLFPFSLKKNSKYINGLQALDLW